tara:strand:+ start:458 stop:859 length:402 start_codon:yes stop_codon:yes gene_type:complete
MGTVSQNIQEIYFGSNYEGGVSVCWIDKKTGKFSGEENFKKGVTFPEDENGINPTGVLHGFTTYLDEEQNLLLRHWYQDDKLIWGWNRMDGGQFEFGVSKYFKETMQRETLEESFANVWILKQRWEKQNVQTN